ncbi:MAG: eukaryotic-like serine/threonine-protein kinase [Blastocatellia bacterium]|jgi:serine/threonine protein kinase|nr:eukaryotic-like serine/threonine-protein kinase [Blastocatellia bacterium]
MQPERWQQISGIFKSALALEPDQRKAYVAGQCGADESLRREVEKLIDSHHHADQENFIQAPAVAEVASLLAAEADGSEVNQDVLEPDQLISHYRILKKLGEGGMGEVYLAQDINLDRTVALKILPADVAADKRRMQRFKQEAKLASSLNQPNILTIFEFGDTDSLHFIVSEYVDGATLREHLIGKQLKLAEMIDISMQVVAALDAAHEAKIVHRDIKPENIMVRRRDRVVKVLDFGLAKLSEPVTTGGLSDTEANTAVLVRTIPGSIMGTVNYMSPEQAQALRVDERTDLWSTGVVIYEMISGRVPFTGVTSSHTIVDILEKEPLLLSALGGGNVPPELQRIVSKALAKNTDERYQTAKDMLIDLRNLKRRLELDVEIERSVAPPSGLPATSARVPGADSATTRRSESEAIESRQPRRTKLIAGIALAVVLVAGIAVAANWSRLRPATGVAPVPPSAPVAERKLSYWMTVQKYREGRPFEDPFRLSGEINFEKDYRVRLNLSSTQPGYLYILNEGPSADGATSFVVLFPSTTANDGLSYVAENQRVEIPQQSWFVFDAEQGTEKLWLVFAASAVPELEAVKVANRTNRGLVKDASLNTRVEEFLKANSAAKPTLEKDDQLKQTSLRIAGPVLVHAIKLEHH